MTIVLFTFVLILGIVLGGYYAFVVRPETDERTRLLRRLDKTAATRAATVGQLERQTQQLSAVRALNQVLSRTKGISQPLDRLVNQSGLKLTVGTLVMASVLAACAGYLLVKWYTHYTLLGLVVAPILGAIPYMVVQRIRTRRFDKFEEQFPECIELLARALRAGHSFPTGLLMVTEEMAEPIGTEFKLVYDQQNFGMPMNDALKALAQRVPILDARFFVTAVITQRETGGNLSEILDNLATVIRDRFKVKRQVRVVTAHGRITGWILAALPPGLAMILAMIAPEHMKPMITDPLGIQMIAIGGTLQVIGTLIIRKLVNIRY